MNPSNYGEYTAQHIDHAQFLPLTTEEHLLLDHQAEVQTKVNVFLRQHAAGP